MFTTWRTVRPFPMFSSTFYLDPRNQRREEGGVFKGSKVGTDSPTLGTMHSEPSLALRVPLLRSTC